MAESGGRSTTRNGARGPTLRAPTPWEHDEPMIGARVTARQEAVLDSMADHIVAVARVWDQAVQARLWEPAPDSFCTWERTQLYRKRGPVINWDDESSQHAVWMSMALLTVSAQQLRGMAALLRAREVIFPLAPLCRTIFETSGHIAWLLDPRPTVRERAARAFLARLIDITRGKAAAKELSQPMLNSFGDALHQLRKVDLPKRFYPSEVERTDAGELIIAKQRYPGLSALMPYLDEVHRHDWNSPGMYSWLSNVSHPTPNVLVVLSARDGDLARVQIPDAGYPYRICRAGLLAFLRGWGLVDAYLGHNAGPLESLTDAIDELPEN